MKNWICFGSVKRTSGLEFLRGNWTCERAVTRRKANPPCRRPDFHLRAFASGSPSVHPTFGLAFAPPRLIHLLRRPADVSIYTQLASFSFSRASSDCCQLGLPRLHAIHGHCVFLCYKGWIGPGKVTKGIRDRFDALGLHYRTDRRTDEKQVVATPTK